MTDHPITVPSPQGGVPAALTRPNGDGPAPAVLLLHGTASHRDEVGGMFARLASALAASGVASLRIDFAGCGASTRPQTDLTVTGELSDARLAYRWLRGRDDIDADRVAVLGFSQGGMIAALLAGAEPGLAGLATWSSGIADGAFAPLAPAFAGAGDHATVDLGFTRFTFSRAWWDEIRAIDLRAALAGFDRPVLAVAGSDDDAVDPAASLALAGAVASGDVTTVKVAGADHIFNVLGPGEDRSSAVVALTADWFASRLDGAR
ncbi:alpha/beta hydrolase family protein [Actinomadura rayongensis]|uniref:Alpha/beta fold hydrolase n=1 Tax=Actinomadura rayongensis TaxID=1429076 RepID=A0A6I4WEY9_9ACTN|nr:alpha/beta fold hydrolase [Actinomadura rayongensis]MXQ68331.1 alpha/beta fold hydrolase [Actinomadura rayongensis]